MNVSPKTKAGCLMSLLAAACLGAGFLLGVAAHHTWKKKTEDPAFMRWAAMKHLEKLKLTPEQTLKVQARVDAAVQELVDYRQTALKQIWEIIDRTSDGIQEDLTTDQQQAWQTLRPKRP
jgi:hypothetical protein